MRKQGTTGAEIAEKIARLATNRNCNRIAASRRRAAYEGSYLRFAYQVRSS
jgi:hypothetical protein